MAVQCAAPLALALTPPPPVLALPPDALRAIFSRLDLPSKLAVLCVCKDWNDTASDPTLWRTICVPPHKAFRLWDQELECLVRRSKGQLSVLRVAGSGITGKALIRLAQSKSLAPAVLELDFSQCCNLKVADILAFLQRLAPSEAPKPWNTRALSASVTAGQHAGLVESCGKASSNPRSPSGFVLGPRGQQSESQMKADRDASVSQAVAEVLELCDVVPPPPPPSFVVSLKVAGCKQMGVWEVQHLQRLVRVLDVGVCSCGRPGVLHRCSRGAGLDHRMVGQEGTRAGQMPEHAHLPSTAQTAATGPLVEGVPPTSANRRPGLGPDSAAFEQYLQGVDALAGTPQDLNSTTAAAVPSSAVPIRCPGLCAPCAELFKGCGSGVCGACWEPQALLHLDTLRTRLRLWQARRDAMSILRNQWTDFRYGVEQRPVRGGL